MRVLNPSLPTSASQIPATCFGHKTRPHLHSVWFEKYYTTLVWTNTNSSPFTHSPSAPPFVWWYTLPQNPNDCYHNPGRGTAPVCRQVRRREQRKTEDCDRTQMTYNPFLYLQNEKSDELWSGCQLCVNLILSRPICHSLDSNVCLSLSLFPSKSSIHLHPTQTQKMGWRGN